MTRFELQDPFWRKTGWYEIMRRNYKGKFNPREFAFWERKWTSCYGEWTYCNGEVRGVDESIKDDLVLRSAEQ